MALRAPPPAAGASELSLRPPLDVRQMTVRIDSVKDADLCPVAQTPYLCSSNDLQSLLIRDVGIQTPIKQNKLHQQKDQSRKNGDSTSR